MPKHENGHIQATKDSFWKIPPFKRSKAPGAKIAPQGRAGGDQANWKQVQRGSEQNVLPPPVFGEKTESPAILPKQVKNEPSSSEGDDSMSRLQDLRLNDEKRKNPNPGQKRLPPDSTDGDRRKKHSRSPEVHLATLSSSLPRREPSSSGPLHTDQLGSGQAAEPSSGVYQDAAESPNDRARDSGPRRTDKKTDRQGDRSDSPPDQGGGEDEVPEGDTSMLLQPDTRPITPEQLVNEVKGIYSGLVMVEKKCVEIITQRASTGGKLSNDQWQALIALHRTLLHEHHDFFLASQHPTASPALRRLATKYAMPARMWRNGIHAFLELLRQQLPGSYEHMLAFVYIAYSMMALLKESVPSFLETWIECLGDLARYRMAIEEVDMRDREIWSNVARMWYNQAADRSPNVGRIQHHLAVLARPNVILQLSLYSKALVSVVPFTNARESIMLLFGPFLDKDKAEAQCQKYTPVESSMVTAWGTAFTRGSVSVFVHRTGIFLSGLDGHMSRTTNRWKIQGPEVASSLIAGILDYGSDENHLWQLFTSHAETIKTSQESTEDPPGYQQAVAGDLSPLTKKLHFEYWRSVNADPCQDYPRAANPVKHDEDYTFTSSDEVTSHVLPVFHRTTSIVATKIGDRNTVPYLHLTLAFLWSISFIPGALIFIESYVPWSSLVMYLNTLGRSGVKVAQVESEKFEESHHGLGRQLPEDFLIRGLAWTPYYYPSDFFTDEVVDEEDRQLELPSHTTPRAQRCLWLGVRIATIGRYWSYNVETKQFSTTDYASSLSAQAELNTFDSPNHETTRMSDEPEFDAVMVDV